MAETAVKMSNTSAPEKTEIDQLKNDLRTLREDFSKLGKDVVSATRHGAESATDAARDAWDVTKEHGVKAKHDVEHTIEKHPLAAVAIALGVGVVIGKILDRR